MFSLRAFKASVPSITASREALQGSGIIPFGTDLPGIVDGGFFSGFPEEGHIFMQCA